MKRTQLRRSASWRLLFALLTVVFAATSARMSAQSSVQQVTTPVSQPAVSLKVGFVTTLADGKSGASSGWAGGGRGLHVGESATVGIQSGSEQLGGDTAIGAGVEPNLSHALHVWTVTVQPVAVSGEKITFAVDWKRFDATAGGRHDLGAGDRRTITLNEGEHHVLDFVSATNARPGTCANMMIQVEASLVDDPRIADTTLGYDLWLVDEAPGGRQATRHMEIAGGQRESIDFHFLPIGWAADGSPVAADGRPDVLVEVSGTIRGRLQPDGSLQIGVTPARAVRLGGMGRASTGYRETLLTARPGETIRMDIPPSGPGAAQTHHTSLTVTVRPY